eukprot:460143-Ditylum_brightwellii.AAC.1
MGYPTDVDLKNCQHIELTSESLWTPYQDKDNGACMVQQKDVMTQELTGNLLLSWIVQSARLIMAATSKLHWTMMPEELCKKWPISLVSDMCTLKATLNNEVCVHEGPTNQKYCTQVHQ